MNLKSLGKDFDKAHSGSLCCPTPTPRLKKKKSKRSLKKQAVRIYVDKADQRASRADPAGAGAGKSGPHQPAEFEPAAEAPPLLPLPKPLPTAPDPPREWKLPMNTNIAGTTWASWKPEAHEQLCKAEEANSVSWGQGSGGAFKKTDPHTPS
eukprot:1161629-Pelagomonas_calceolata.AAC.3